MYVDRELERMIYKKWKRQVGVGGDDEDKDGKSQVSSEDSDSHVESSVESDSDSDYDFEWTQSSKNIPPTKNTTANTKTQDVDRICSNCLGKKAKNNAQD